MAWVTGRSQITTDFATVVLNEGASTKVGNPGVMDIKKAKRKTSIRYDRVAATINSHRYNTSEWLQEIHQQS